MNQIFMCEPNNFNVNYEINDWMSGKIGGVESDLATSQWNNLHTLLSVDNNIIVLPKQESSIPDIVFTANAGFLFNNNFITSSFANFERQPESFVYSNFFKNIGFKVDNYFLDNHISFEGAGDILTSEKHNVACLAYGFRTDYMAHSYIKDVLHKENKNYNLLHLRLTNPKFYHLDTCLCPTKLGHVIYYPNAFDLDSIRILNDTFGNDLIAVDEFDAKNFICNAVSFGNKIVLNKVSEKLHFKLTNLGYVIYETNMSEFIKSGGSCKCLTLDMKIKI